MSLFKTRTFWATNCDEEEQFDQNSLIVTKLNSDGDYIVTGSHSGVLRIFKPSSELNDNNNVLMGYKITDLLIEKLLDAPILHVGCGRLVSGSNNSQLAILHSRLLSVYSLVIKEGATEHGTQNVLQLHYEHKLRRSAANFTTGPFGGVLNRDFICVQSLDGMLSFFEQESFGFCCFLPDVLLPSPLVFVRKSDSFVICNSNWNLASFQYKILSEAGQNSTQDDESGKKIVGDWNYNIGEAVIDLDVIEDWNTKENVILVLGERNLFCLASGGSVRFMKKFDYSPICFTNYILDDHILSLVVSETSTLLIYQNTSLKWSSKLDILPIAIERAFLKTIKGVLVVLSETGNLQCCYLGTQPSLFVSPPLSNQCMDFDKVGLELATLNKIIKNSYGNEAKLANASAERELELHINVEPPHLAECLDEIDSKMGRMCTVSVEIVPQAPFDEVQVALNVCRPLKIEPHCEFFANLSERTVISCRCYVKDVANVASLRLQVAASFISNLGIPRSLTKSAILPLTLVLETCAPRKENEHKVTININQSPIGLSSLFPEFIGSIFNATSSAIGFRTPCGEVVTILLAKSSERYRVQSDSFISLNLLIEETVERLRKHFSNNTDFAVSFNSALPAKETLQYIHKHFAVRQRFNALQSESSQLAVQFRLIQKRLIAKFKVKNPTPLTNLEMLLNDTFDEIMATSEKLEQGTNELIKAQIELSCALNTVVNLIKLMDINVAVKTMIESTFSPHIYDLEGQNWEDVTDAGLCYMLRTILAKSEKDKLRAAQSSFEEVKDVAKLEKHFTQVLERIPKGVLLETDFEEGSAGEVNEGESTPIGSQIGEASSRLLSARKGLLRNRVKICE